MTLAFSVDARDGASRAGVMVTARGRVSTPCFMPVGTRGAVRTLSADDLGRLGAQVVLANTYHLMLRPGAGVIAGLGGLHRFTGWPGHLLTDSGGFQVFSLGPEVDDGGVSFRSVYDGSAHRLTPEGAVAVQAELGADIQMALDVCPPLPSPRSVVEQAVERTLAWAERARAAPRPPAQALFGIVQGGTDAELRASSAARTVAYGFDGYGIGGLSVGESRADMLGALAAAVAELPADRPRYLMGVGDPVGMVESVALGVDLFDCVLPTRLARHGTVLTAAGKLHLANAVHSKADVPLEAGCACPTCRRWSRAYLRHLLVVREPTAGRLLTLHNLWYTLALVDRARAAIVAGRFDELRAEVAAAWGGG
ncbi:MAG: tRNA guanosine(34) transglycosylase Tgt [Acidimicrobiales bacterium]